MDTLTVKADQNINHNKTFPDFLASKVREELEGTLPHLSTPEGHLERDVLMRTSLGSMHTGQDPEKLKGIVAQFVEANPCPGVDNEQTARIIEKSWTQAPFKHMETEKSPTVDGPSNTAPPQEKFDGFLARRVREDMEKSFPGVDSKMVDEISASTLKQMQAGKQRGLLDQITAEYVKANPAPNAPDQKAVESVLKSSVAPEKEQHTPSPSFGAAFEKMGAAVEETRASPTRPMKARLAMGLSKFGGMLERNLNEGMAYVVPAAAMFAGAVGGVAGGLYGFAQNDPVMLYGALGGGAALAASGVAAMDLGMNPNSRFRKMTAGLKDKCEQPLKTIEMKAKSQGREWDVTKKDLGDPEPSRGILAQAQQAFSGMSR
jgi:hypothetical protein